ncbi:MAG: thioredoxin family protein [Pirellulaceae bacterium]
MLGMTLALLLQVSAVGETKAQYNQAFQQAEETGKPMLVLVGANWCPGCVTMKSSVMPRLVRSGKLRDVSYIEIDADTSIGGRMMRGGSIPQLIMYRKTRDGWKRSSLVGVQSESTIQSMVDKAVASQKEQEGLAAN